MRWKGALFLDISEYLQRRIVPPGMDVSFSWKEKQEELYTSLDLR